MPWVSLIVAIPDVGNGFEDISRSALLPLWITFNAPCIWWLRMKFLIWFLACSLTLYFLVLGWCVAIRLRSSNIGFSCVFECF